MRIAIVDDLAAERHFLREQLEQKLYRMGIQADILEYTCGEAFLAVLCRFSGYLYDGYDRNRSCQRTAKNRH